MPAITLLSWNERLLVERLEEKATAVNELWKAANFDWEKVLFCMLLKSFGGTVNGEAFLQLGKHLDFSIIRKERSHPLHFRSTTIGASRLYSLKKLNSPTRVNSCKIITTYNRNTNYLHP